MTALPQTPSPAPPGKFDAMDLPAFVGPYRILELIGAGGQGRIYKVLNTKLERFEALKLLRPVAASDADHVRRFEREIRVLARLRHPNIISVYDVGQIEGCPYYTMELIAGESVGAVLDRLGRFPPRTALRIVRDAARALSVAHALGIIHRDFKPHNVLLAAAEPAGDEPIDRAEEIAFSTGRAAVFRVVITDFGLAREGVSRSDLTVTGMSLGTPAYASPEQLEANEALIDHRTDVWSLGATLYHMLTGHRAFEAEAPLEILRQVALMEPPPLRARVPTLARDIETITLRCLEKEPHRRYENAAALADDIDRYLKGHLIRARPAGLWRKAWRWTARRRALVVTATASVLAGLAVASALLLAPAWKQAREDREALRRALDERQAARARFESLLSDGRFDEAIEWARPRYGSTPPLPRLNDPSRAADPAYAALNAPGEIRLPQAYRRRGLDRLARGDARGRGDLANAYALTHDRPDEADTGRDALLDLAEAFAAARTADSAAWTAQRCAARFGLSEPRTRAVLAAALEQVGRLEDAAALWATLHETPSHEAAAREALEVLGALLPRTSVPVPRGAFEAADLDGDGLAEIVHAGPEAGGWRLRVFSRGRDAWASRAELNLPVPLGVGRPLAVTAADVDGDGRREILVAGGDGANRLGRLFLVGIGGDSLRLLDRIELTSGCHQILCADLDGDGGPEIILPLSFFDRRILVLHWHGERLHPIRSIPLGCDPQLVHVLPDGRIVAWLGPWHLHHAYAFHLLAPDASGDFSWIASSPDRLDGEPGNGVWLDERTLVVAAEALPERRKIEPRLLEGLFRVRLLEPEGFSEAEPLGPAWTRTGGWRMGGPLSVGGSAWLAALKEHQLLLLSPEGRARTLGVAGPVWQARTADLDGDGTPELIFMSSDRLEIHGDGSFRPGPPPSTVSADVFEAARPEPAQEFLDAGLYAEAAALCRESLAVRDEPLVRFRLAQALAGARLWDEAAEAFGAAARDAALRLRALMARAHALERARRWAPLVECLDDLRLSPGAGALERDWAEARLAWARPAAAMHQRLQWGPWDDSFLCENPLKAAVGPKGLTVWSSSETHADAAGLLFRYEGGPLRLRARFRVGAVPWDSTASLGIQSVAALESSDRPDAFPYVMMRIWGKGASDQPTVVVDVWYGGDPSEYCFAELPAEAFIPDPRQTYEATLEYVPGLDRVFLEIHDADGARRVGPVTLELKFPLPPGLYVAGRAIRDRKRVGGAEAAAPMTYESIVLEAAGASVARTSYEPSGAAGRLALANGRLVRNRLDEAEAAYDEALASAGTDERLRARALLFRGVLKLRRADLTGAAKDARAAQRADAKEVDLLLGNQAPAALNPLELRLLRPAATEF
jgi:hypothetical protein